MWKCRHQKPAPPQLLQLFLKFMATQFLSMFSSRLCWDPQTGYCAYCVPELRAVLDLQHICWDPSRRCTNLCHTTRPESCERYNAEAIRVKTYLVGTASKSSNRFPPQNLRWRDAFWVTSLTTQRPTVGPVQTKRQKTAEKASSWVRWMHNLQIGVESQNGSTWF